MIRRRDFLSLTAAATLAAPLRAFAQQAQMKRLGLSFTLGNKDPQSEPYMAAMRKALEARGWTEGQNLEIDYTWSATTADLGRANSVQLLSEKPDVLLVAGTTAAQGVAETTKTVPVVFALAASTSGLVANPSHPEGNVTGFTNTEASMGGKWFELLKEVVPNLKRAGFIYAPPGQGSGDFYLPSFEAAANAVGVQPVRLMASAFNELEPLIAELAGSPNAGIATFNAPQLSYTGDVVQSVIRHRLPHVFGHALYAAAGSMITYSVDPYAQFGQAADYAGLILNGTKVSDLPVQGPSKFTLSVNLKTAKAVGVTIPPDITVQADEVIQ